jgi:protein-tyrosine phosphatase
LSDVVAATRPVAEIRERALRETFVIFELLSDALIPHATAIVRRLGAAALTPVIAHPERARSVQVDPGQVDALRAGGALIQVVASSLTGDWGGDAEEAAWALLASGRVDLVGSDAHGVVTRPCRLREAEALVVDRLGRQLWTRLTEDTPAALVGAASPSG